LFLKRLFGIFIYIVMADAFAMTILYKNFYKQTIFTEVNETLGSSGPKMTSTGVEPITSAEISNHSIEEDDDGIPQLTNDTEFDDPMEGFAKDTALGDVFTTKGDSNI